MYTLYFEVFAKPGPVLESPRFWAGAGKQKQKKQQTKKTTTKPTTKKTEEQQAFRGELRVQVIVA